MPNKLKIFSLNKKQFAEVANGKKAKEKPFSLNDTITFGQKPGSIGDRIGSVLNLGSSKAGQGYSITPLETAKQTAINYATGEVIGAATKPVIKFVSPYVKQAGKAIKNKIFPAKAIPKVNKDIYDINSKDDFNRFLRNTSNEFTRSNSNQLPLPPSEINIPNSPRLRDLPNYNTSPSFINLQKYENMSFKEISNKNPTLAQTLKKHFDTFKEVAKETDYKIGSKISKFLNKKPELDEIVKEANKKLKTGVGVKKTSSNLELKKFNDRRMDVVIDGKTTGSIVLGNISRPRSFTDMLLNKKTNYPHFENAKYRGYAKTSDMPFTALGIMEQESLKKQGISGEINKAISETLKDKGNRLYSGGTGHTTDGWRRYNNLESKGLVEDITSKGIPKDPHNAIFMYKKEGAKNMKSYKKGTKKIKYNTGTQQIYLDTPDYSKVDARKAKTTANNTLVDGTFDSAGQSLMPFNPVAGTSLTVGNKVGQIGQSVIGDNTAGRTFNYGAKGAGAGLAVASSLGPMGMAVAPIAIAGGAALGAGYGLITGNANDAKDKREKRKAERAVTLLNANKKFSENASTDAQSFLAKKGKYKVKGRVIETEGREPIFSPKKADGTRDLLYFNPNDPTHNEGGIKIAVTKKACGSKNMKYKKGTSAIKAVIPAGSSIITAEGGKNIQAIKAYKKRDYKTLDKIINSMPEDKGVKKDGGSRWTIATDPTEDNIKGELGNTVKLRKAIQAAIQAGDYTKAQKLGGYLDKNKNWVYKNPNKKYKGKEELAAKNNYNDIIPMENKVPKFNTSNNTTSDSNLSTNKVETTNQTTSQKDKVPFDVSSIPSIAEITARQALLNKGVDKVPENYVKFGRYKYASQLPKNLQENMMATNTAKQSVKNASGGNTGNYLSNVSNINTSRLKANNDAVITDTLARQDVLNKNVDVSNNEIQINTGLKNEFNNQKAQNLGAYRNQVIVQGQSIDSTLDSAKKESWAKKRDSQLLDILKTRNYNYSEDSGITLSKKGLKNVKKYKTTRK